MSPDSERRDPVDGSGGNDTGAPIRELGDLRQQPQPGFLTRIRNSIDRRRLGSDLTEFGWRGVIAVLIELIDVAMQLVAGQSTNNKRR